MDFAQNPASLFLTLSRYKIKDTYATSQMLEHAMNAMNGKGFTLHELKNMMISTEGRPKVDVCKFLLHNHLIFCVLIAIQSRKFASNSLLLAWIELQSIQAIHTFLIL